MTTKGDFAQRLLQAIGNNNPSANTRNFVIAWQLWESGFGGNPLSGTNASNYNNPLNTTLNYGGGTNVNSVGVKSYPSIDVGIQATALTLEGGNYYPDLLQALKTNNENALGFNGNSVSASISRETGTWGTGSADKIARTANQISGQIYTPGTTTSNNPVVDAGVNLGATTANTGLPNPVAWVDSLNNVLTHLGDQAFWMRIAKGFIGVILLVIGLILLIKTLIPQGVTSAIAKVAAV